jgi:hypothetical protein
MSLPLPAHALPLPSASVRPLATCLHDLHARRLHELREVLESARDPEGGVWRRWGALRFLKQLLARWFERERAAVEGAACHFAAGQMAHLWTGAELVAMLCWQLDHAPGLCHQAAEFARVTLKLETVLEHWCREVEEALDPLSWRELSHDQRQEFAALAEEEPDHVT